MTSKQFIQIAELFNMDIRQVNDMCHAPDWPTPNQIQKAADEMADIYTKAGDLIAPTDANIEIRNSLMARAQFLRNL